MKTWILFDWGDTLMRVDPKCKGKMKDWLRVEEIPGARKTLHTLHGHLGLALATGAADSEEADIRAALDRVDLNAFFKQVFCSRDLGLKKDDPAFYTAILERLKLDPDHAVMVGDDFHPDVEVPRQAGLRAVWFNARSDENRVGEHFTTIHHLEALPGVLTGWGLMKRI